MTETVTVCEETSKSGEKSERLTKKREASKRNLAILLAGSQALHNSSLHPNGSIFPSLFSTSFLLLSHLIGTWTKAKDSIPSSLVLGETHFYDDVVRVGSSVAETTLK